ncbi:MAG: anaerobic sulfatase maturase [Acidimicrobiaceae bacterium]|nr:anaerobic sulfatase maturase [Acidimicrobiaceae bacterium]
MLLDDEWGEFLAKEKFLVGVSIDGPEDIHNRYRVTRGGEPTWHKVMAGIEVLKKHNVEFNTLTVLHKHNADHPKELYEFLTREVGSHFLQFIPIVERVADNLPPHLLQLVGPEFRDQATVTEWSVGSEQYGRFLNGVFDQWVRKDIGQYFVQIFDTTLAGWMNQNPGLCIFQETCGDAMIIEHNGDVYSCDHFVYPEYNLGNVADTTIREMAESPEQRKFGTDKRDTLPQYCLDCEFKQVCNGGCPKQRFIKTPDGEDGLNYLCAGYKTFFGHTKPYLMAMANELRKGQPAANIMQKTSLTPESSYDPYAGLGRNDACPCDSGKKFKRCHGIS